MADVCPMCSVAFSPSLLANVVYGPVTMPCGCKWHQPCAEAAIRDGLTCICNKAATELEKAKRDGVPVDFGNMHMMRVKAYCDLLAASPPVIAPKVVKPKAAAVAAPKPTKPPAAPMPTLPPMPRVQTRPKVPMENKTEIRRANLPRLAASGVAPEKLHDAGIPLNEAVFQKMTIDSFVSSDMTLENYAHLLDGPDKWTQMLNLGLKWQHLKNKTKFPVTAIVRYLNPDPAQFIDLFMDKSELKYAYTAPEHERGSHEYYAELKLKDMARVNPLDKLWSLEYNSGELAALGVDVGYLMRVMGATPKEAERLYNYNKEQSKVVWGPSITERTVKNLRF